VDTTFSGIVLRLAFVLGLPALVVLLAWLCVRLGADRE
jgi:hypothetical protein